MDIGETDIKDDCSLGEIPKLVPGLASICISTWFNHINHIHGLTYGSLKKSWLFFIEPRMICKTIQSDSICGTNGQTTPNEIFDFVTESKGRFEKDLSTFDLMVIFIWYVTANHVV